MNGIRCSGLRTSLMLLASGACQAYADDKFIVQPKLRIPSATNEAVPLSPQAVQQPPGSAALAEPWSVSGQAGSARSPDHELQWVSRGAEVPRSVNERTTGTSAMSGARGATVTVGQPVPTRSAMAQPSPTTLGKSMEIVVKPTQEVEVRDGRKALASLVSNRIVSSVAPIESSGIRPVDAAPGWQAIGERLSKHLKESDNLLRRNAILSSRQEAETAARYLAQTLDLAVNNCSAEPHWYVAEQAFREASDFYRSQSSDPKALRRIVDSHQTPVLKTTDLKTVSPLVAAQHYRQYAFNCLVVASQGHPWASEIYCSLGRTYQAEAERGAANDEKRSRAATYYRAAVSINSRNTLAANQLAYMLLQMDRPQEAMATLIDALRVQPSEPALENLIEASRRLKDTRAYEWGMAQLTAMRGNQPAQVPVPPVTEVDVQTFMALSPYNSGPQSQSPSLGRTAAVPGSNR
jgi:tetratricopeptide (TPR) repeat protein